MRWTRHPHPEISPRGCPDFRIVLRAAPSQFPSGRRIAVLPSYPVTVAGAVPVLHRLPDTQRSCVVFCEDLVWWSLLVPGVPCPGDPSQPTTRKLHESKGIEPPCGAPKRTKTATAKPLRSSSSTSSPRPNHRASITASTSSPRDLTDRRCRPSCRPARRGAHPSPSAARCACRAPSPGPRRWR